MIIYVVKQGDSIYSIANMFGVSYEKIVADNQLANPSNLVVGQTLVILAPSITYTLKSGDRLMSIANDFNISLEDLLRANPQLLTPNSVNIGDTITIPLPSATIGSMEVNGFAFPNITRETLEQTLPNLTYLSIFSYQINPDGTLIGVNDEVLINMAKEYNVAPLLVVTNIEQDGGFSGELTNAIFTNPQAQSNLINNILTTMQQKDYYGVVVDFEYIFPEDRENYNEFLRELTAVMHNNGYIVASAVAPKINDEMEGVLYEAHDYRTIGEIVDIVIIMTYEWGYTYGPPMAVAPLNSVRQVLDYAVTVIPANKIFMGVPNYGYDWTLPFRQGTAARTVTNVGAVDLAWQEGAFIEFDTRSQAPYFNYWRTTNGVANEHVVWFEDARSIDAKLRLVQEYGLRGVSYWTINRYFPQNWLVLEELYNVIKVI